MIQQREGLKGFTAFMSDEQELPLGEHFSTLIQARASHQSFVHKQIQLY